MTLQDYQNQNWYIKALEQLKRHEGFRDSLYKDPSSKSNVYSTGYGFNTSEPFVRNILKKYGWNGSTISRDTANKAIGDIAYSMMPMIRKQIPNFDKLPDNAKGVVLNMAYQLGGTTFPKFEKMIKALNNNDLIAAEKEMANSAWGKDKKLLNRTIELRHQMNPEAHPNYNPAYNYAANPGSLNNTPKNPIRYQGNRKYYTIQSGDTLDKISKRYKVNLNKIYKLNPNIKPNRLKPGQEIRLAQQFTSPNYQNEIDYTGAENNIHLASAESKWLKISKELKSKLATMKKEIPLNDISDMEIKPTTITKDKVPVIIKKLFNRVIKDTNEINKKANDESLESVLDQIYNEDKKYWPNGLNKDLYNGSEDKIELIKNSDNKAIGFRGLQVRNNDGDKKEIYYSIGILPEYRGYGNAKKALKDLLSKNINNKCCKHFYTVHKDNIPSMALYHSLIEDYPELNLKIF